MRIIAQQFAANLRHKSTVLTLLEAGCGFYDIADRILLIPDIGGDEGATLYGVMTADFDPYELARVGLWEALEDPVDYALGSIPAPGTGAPDRMGFMETEEAVDWISRNPTMFRNPTDGFICLCS